MDENAHSLIITLHERTNDRTKGRSKRRQRTTAQKGEWKLLSARFEPLPATAKSAMLQSMCATFPPMIAIQFRNLAAHPCVYLHKYASSDRVGIPGMKLCWTGHRYQRELFFFFMELREKAHFNRNRNRKNRQNAAGGNRLRYIIAFYTLSSSRGVPSMKVEINYICGGIFPARFASANQLQINCMFVFGLLCKHVPPILKKGCFERNLNAKFIERFILEINRFNLLFIPLSLKFSRKLFVVFFFLKIKDNFSIR